MERKCITGSQHAAPTAAAAGAGIGRQRAGGLPGLPRVLCPEPDLELQRHRQRGPRQDRRRLQVVRQQGDKGGHSISRAKVARFWPFSHGGDKKNRLFFCRSHAINNAPGFLSATTKTPCPAQCLWGLLAYIIYHIWEGPGVYFYTDHPHCETLVAGLPTFSEKAPPRRLSQGMPQIVGRKWPAESRVCGFYARPK